MASVLAPAVSNPNTDDEPGMTWEEESEDKRVPNHLVLVRTLTYQATHKKLLAPVTLDPTPEDLEAQECVRSGIAKIEKSYWVGGPLPLRATEKLMTPHNCWRLLVSVALSPPNNPLCLRRWSS